MFVNIKNTYQEFPKTFWVLMLSTFIDGIGGFMLFPFFALYITDHFGVGVTEVGLIFALFSAGSIVGGIVSGTLTDKYGRKFMLLFGLVVSGISSILMGLIQSLTVFYGMALFMGLISNSGGPAQQAMVTDLLPEENRTEGFGIIRIVGNLAAVIGPALGSLILASQSFMVLFIADAVSSTICAIIVFFVIPETKPEKKKGEKEKTVLQTMVGYKYVLRDWIFMAFLGVTMLSTLVYMQMNSTLSVFLRDEHGFQASKFGWLLSMNAAMVVLFQFWITRKIKRYRPMIMMAIGTLFYAVGFAMYGFTSTNFMFFVAMFIITIGEMIVTPFAQSLVSNFAPEDKRGRYMAVFGFSWAIPSLFGVLIAGVILDGKYPNLLWYFCGIILLLGVWGYLWLDKVLKRKAKVVEDPKLKAKEPNKALYL